MRKNKKVPDMKFINIVQEFNDYPYLSIKGLMICPYIQTGLRDVFSVHSFNVETVSLMEKNIDCNQ